MEAFDFHSARRFVAICQSYDGYPRDDIEPEPESRPPLMLSVVLEEDYNRLLIAYEQAIKQSSQSD